MCPLARICAIACLYKNCKSECSCLLCVLILLFSSQILMGSISTVSKNQLWFIQTKRSPMGKRFPSVLQLMWMKFTNLKLIQLLRYDYFRIIGCWSSRGSGRQRGGGQRGCRCFLSTLGWWNGLTHDKIRDESRLVEHEVELENKIILNGHAEL